jgi:hypothetical protein
MCIDISYQYDYGFTLLGGKNVYVNGDTLYYSQSFKLSDCRNGVDIHPHVLLVDNFGLSEAWADSCFGGSIYGKDINLLDIVDLSSLYSCTSSLMKVSIRLSARQGRKVVASSRSYTQVVNLLTGDCEFYYSNVDEDTDEYVTDSDYYKTTDSSGNVTINNNNTGGGSSSGGSSSATGGSSSAEGGTATANANVGDITNNNTFTFPNKIQIDLNVNGLEGSSTGSNSSGSDSDSDKSWWDKLLDAISSFLNFLAGVVTNLFETIGNLIETFADGVSDFIQYIFEGFGLFSSDGGMSDLLQENLSFLPSEVWSLIMFGLSAVILVSIINRFWK